MKKRVAAGIATAGANSWAATGQAATTTPSGTLDVGGAIVRAAGSALAGDLQAVVDRADTATLVGIFAAAANTYILAPVVPWDPTVYVAYLAQVTTGSLSLPSGYSAVVFGSGTSATVTGGDDTVSVVSGGAIDFNGQAKLIAASGGSGHIVDRTPFAFVDVGGGAYSVTAAGVGSVVRVSNGNPILVVASAGVSIILGEGPQDTDYYTAYAAAASVSGATVKSGFNDHITIDGAGHLIVDNLPFAGATTITALSGSSTIFGGTGDVYDGGGGSAVTRFIATGDSQTVTGGSSNDTVFGQVGSVVYNQGGGAVSYFVGGSGPATVNAGGAGAIFGGSGPLFVNLGVSGDVFVGGSGSDTIAGGTGIPAIFGGAQETMHLVGSRFAYVVPLGEGGTMDASGALGGTNFFALTYCGDQTLVGNPQGTIADTFQLVNAGVVQAHTLTVEGWHPGDGLFLIGYGAADVDRLASRIAGGASSFALSDGTIVTFVGSHPTATAGSVAY